MYKQFLNKIKEYGTIIIHRHGRPDGDAIGSQIGLKEAILATFPYKKVYAVGDVNPKVSFVGDVDEIEDSVYNNALVIVLDSSDTNMINDERYKLGRYIIKVDHHISNVNYGDMNIVDTSEISCASLLAKIIFSCNMKLTSHGARALFTGIVTDSGRFRYSGVSSETFNIASKLMKYDFDFNEIYNNLYIEDLEIVKLRAEMVSKFKISTKGVAYLVNTQEDVIKYNTDIFTISRGMVNVMAGIKGIDIWANFTEEQNGKVIVELRSSKYNVNQIAVKYGGGGHKFASGATVEGLHIIDAIIKDLEDIME